MLVVTLLACSENLPEMSDNSLEAAGAQTGDVLEAEGPALFAATSSGTDWSVYIDDLSFAWHSSSHADLSVLDGRTLKIEVDEAFGEVGSARMLEDGEPVLVASTGDGSEAFGRELWTFGEAVGTGQIVNELDEPTNVVFHEVVLHADDGDRVLMPGEPTAVVIDGASWRVTVVASYTIEVTGGTQAGCGPSDLISVELLKQEDAADEAPLTRPAERFAPMSSCG